jgi:hypothetical protein
MFGSAGGNQAQLEAKAPESSRFGYNTSLVDPGGACAWQRIHAKIP